MLPLLPGITFSFFIQISPTNFQNPTQTLLHLGHCYPSEAIINPVSPCLLELKEVESIWSPLVTCCEAEMTETSELKPTEDWQLSHGTSEKAS